MRKWLTDWEKLNPILADGEVGEIIGMLETKTGDGKTPWNELLYTGESDSVGTFSAVDIPYDNSTSSLEAADVQAALDELSTSNGSSLAALTTTVAGKLSKSSNLSDLNDVAVAKANLSLVKGDVSLGNVDNTSDANKPVSTAQQTALNAKAPLASPVFTGTPTAPTQTPGDSSTKLATTAYTDAAVSTEATARASAITTAVSAETAARASAITTVVADEATARTSAITTAVSSEATARASAITTAIANLVNSAPGTMDTLGEIAILLAADESAAAALTAAVALKAPLASPALTGNPTAPTPSSGDNDTSIATSAFVSTAVSDHVASDAAHPASKISSTTSGLVVVTHTNVQAALADLDAATNLRARRSATWLANTDYKAGEIVVQGGFAYAAAADFTSGVSFVESNWICLTSGQEGGYVPNETGTTYALTVTETALSLLTLLIPQSTRPIWVTAEAWVDVTTAAASGATGTAALTVKDDQGTPVTLCEDITSFEGAAGTAGYGIVRARGRIAPNTPQRTYTAYALRSGDSTFRASLLHGSGATYLRSYLSWAYA